MTRRDLRECVLLTAACWLCAGWQWWVGDVTLAVSLALLGAVGLPTTAVIATETRVP